MRGCRGSQILAQSLSSFSLDISKKEGISRAAVSEWVDGVEAEALCCD